MCDPIENLKAAKINNIFHATRIIYAEAIADAGYLGCSSGREARTPGSKKDIQFGGGDYVYFRYIHDNQSTRFNCFGTRSSLVSNIHLVMPVEKLEDKYWFISSVDLNGKLPKGVGGDVIDMPDDKKNATIRGLKRFPNDKNGEIGIYSDVQLYDISHVVVSRDNYDAFRDSGLEASINDMKRFDGLDERVNVVIASDTQVATTKLRNAGPALAL